MIEELRIHTLRERCVRLFLRDEDRILELAARAFSGDFRISAEVRSDEVAAAWVSILVGEQGKCFRDEKHPLHRGRNKQDVAAVELRHAIERGCDELVFTESNRIGVARFLTQRESSTADSAFQVDQAERGDAKHFGRGTDFEVPQAKQEKGGKTNAKRRPRKKNSLAQPPTLLLQAKFIQHHRKKGDLNQEPLKMEEMMAVAGRSKSTISRYLRNKPFRFKNGYSEYVETCSDFTRLDRFIEALEDPRRQNERLEADMKQSLDQISK